MMIRFFFFYILFIFFLFFCFSDVRGSYQDFFEYKLEGNKIYSTLYLDRFYHKFLTKSEKYTDFSGIDYPSLYRDINSLQKKYFFDNFLIRLYITLIAKSKIIIYTNFALSDRNSKLPFYFYYLIDATMQTVVFFDKSQNISDVYLSLRNDYIDFSCEADSIAIGGKLKFKINFLRLQNLNIYDLSGKINFKSFPINTVDFVIHSGKISYLHKDIAVFVSTSKLSGSYNKDLILYSKRINFAKKGNNLFTIDGLSLKFENLDWENFISTHVNLKSDLLRILFNKEEIIFYSLKSDYRMSYLENTLVFQVDYIRWFKSNIQRIIYSHFINAGLISSLQNYKSFIPSIVSKILEMFLFAQEVVESTKSINGLVFTMDLSDNNFFILYRDIFISFGNWGIGLLISGNSWLYSDYSGDIWVFGEKEFGIIRTGVRKAVYFSDSLGLCISWFDKLNFFATDYKNSVFLSDGVLGAKFNNIDNILSFFKLNFLKLNKEVDIFRNFRLNFVPKELLILGVYSPNEFRILFSNKDIYGFWEIDYREFQTFESFLRRFIDILTRSNHVGFWDYKGLFGIYVDNNIFIHSNDLLLYYRVDWEKLKKLYLLLNHYPEISRDFYAFIVKNIDYFYDQILKGSQAIFYKKNEFLVFLHSGELFFNYIGLIVRSTFSKRFVGVVDRYSFIFELYIGKNLFLSAYGLKKIYGQLVIEYDFKKTLSLERFLKILTDRRINMDFFLKEFARESFFDIDIYLAGKKIFGFSSTNEKATIDDLFVDVRINLDQNELILFNQMVNFIDQKELYKAQRVNINGLLKFSKDGVQVYLKDSTIYLGYLLNFFLRIDGLFDLKIKYNNQVRKIDLAVNSFNVVITCWSVDNLQWGNIKIDFSKDSIKVKLFLSNEFLDFINLSNVLYLTNRSKEDMLKLELSYEKGFLYGQVEVDCNLENLIFKHYKFKGIETIGYIAFSSSNFRLDSQPINSIDDFLSFLSKFRIEGNCKVSYYLFIDDIYRRTLQDISFVFDNDNVLLDGKIQVSLREIVKFWGVKIENEYVKEYLDQIYWTGFIELNFQKSKINNFRNFIKTLVKRELITAENKEIFNSIHFSLYFILFGSSYMLSLNPEFKFDGDHYIIDKLKFVLFEASRMILEFSFDYITKRVDNVNLLGIPSFLVNYCEGNMNFSLDFKNGFFVFNFDKFSFTLLSNRIFIDGRMIFMDRGFIAPVVKVNDSVVSLGFDGNVITLVSDLKELDVDSFYYKGNLKVNLIISPVIKEPNIYGNIRFDLGTLEYRGFKNTRAFRIPINVSIGFNSVRFRNNFIDVIFSGNIGYFSGFLVGELRARKGFVILADGLYKVLQGVWSFTREDISGNLYVVLQKISSDIFDYKISIFKGDIKNLSLGEFGRTNNNDDVITNRLTLSFFNTPVLDLIYFSWQGYTIQREIFPNVFVSYFSFYSTNNRYNKLGYDWYYSIDWIVKRLGNGIIGINFRTYSNGRNNVSIIFVKGF